MVSPGTFTDAAYLDAREPAFLAAVSSPTATAPGDWRASTSRPASSPRRSSPARTRCALAAELSLLRPKELLAADGADVDGAARDGSTVPRHARRRLDVRSGAGPRRALRAAADGVARRARARRRAGRRRRRRRHRRRTCATRSATELAHVRDISLRVAADALLDRSRHAPAPERRRRRRRRPRRLAARRDRSHGDGDGRPAAAAVARAAARDAGADSGSARRGRGLRVSRSAERGKLRDALKRHARPRAAGGARLARHGGPARSRRARPVARAAAARPHA